MEKPTCGVMQDLLISYCDGLTGEGVTKLLQEHLEECPRCQHRYREIIGQREQEEQRARAKGEVFLEKIKGIRYYAMGIFIGFVLPIALILIWYLFAAIASYIETMFYGYFL